MISVKQSLTGKVNIGKQIVEPNLINLEITPTKEEQLFKHEGVYGYDEVKINPIPNEYIIPNGTLEISENGIKDVTNYSNVDVNIPEKEILLQDKTIEITENGTTNITVDEGYDGLGNVEVITKISGGELPEKGIIINEYSSNGYPKKITVVGMTSLPTGAFANKGATSTGFLCDNIMTNYEEVILPQEITSIPQECFYQNKGLKNITSTNIKSVNGCSFYKCTSLVRISLPNVTWLNGSASNDGGFAYCTGLKAVWIGSTITSDKINRYTFYNCTSLTKIFIDLPREVVLAFNNYKYAFMNDTSKTGIIVCNDDEGFITKEQFDSIDWSTYEG